MNNFKPGGSVDGHDLAGDDRVSKYADMISDLGRLRHKKTLLYALDEDDNPESVRLCVRQAINRYMPDDVRKIKRFEVRRHRQDDYIVIVCIVKSREG